MGIAHRHYEQTGEVIAPGTTGACPVCRGRTFTIREDDAVGTCTTCHTRIAEDLKAEPSLLSIFRRFLQELFMVFAFTLWRQTDRYADAVVEKFRDDMKIDEQLLRAVGLGMVPEEIDREALVRYLPEESDIDECPEPRKTGREYLEQFTLATHHAVFPHTDAFHRVAGFRALGVDKGVLRDLRMVPGCFGHSLAWLATPAHPEIGERIIVVQDELQWLIYQNALIASGYAPVTGCATGPTGKAAWDVLDMLGGENAVRPIIVCDASPHPAIPTLAGTAQQHQTVTAFESPADTPIRSWFSPGVKPETILQKLTEVISTAVPLYRPYGAVAKQILRTRISLSGIDQEFLANRKVAAIVVRDLLRRGEFLLCHDTPYWQNQESKAVLPIGGREPGYVALMSKFGIVATEGVHRFIAEGLASEAKRRGRAVELPRFARWEEKTGTLYIDKRDGDLLVLNGAANPTIQPNGTADTLFLPMTDAEPFLHTVETPSTSTWADLILDKVNFSEDGTLRPSDRRFLLTIYTLGLFFPDLQPTRPIVAFIGVKGSGKSSACRAIGKVLLGDDFDVSSITTETRRDLEAFLSNSFYAVLDNLDQATKSINDLLATSATGGTLKKRTYYTTNQLESHTLDCFIAITSRTPKFNRDDLADRVLPLRVERIEQFLSESELQTVLKQERNTLWAEMIAALQETVVLLRKTPTGVRPATLRIADFDDFGHRICNGLGIAAYWDDLMRRLVRDQNEFALSGSGVFESLTTWIKKDKNAGRRVETSELFTELGEIAQENNILWGYAGAQSFGQALANLVQPLGEFFDINLQIGHARAKFYTIRPKATEDKAPIPELQPPEIEVCSTLLRTLRRYAEKSVANLRNEEDALQAERRRQREREELKKIAAETEKRRQAELVARREAAQAIEAQSTKPPVKIDIDELLREAEDEIDAALNDDTGS